MVFLMMGFLVGKLFSAVIGAFQKGFLSLLFLIIMCISFQVNGQINIPDSIINKAATLTAEKRIVYYNSKIFDFARNNPAAARLLIDSVSKLLKSHPDPGNQMYFLRGMGLYQQAQNNYDSAIYYYRLAQELNHTTNDNEAELSLLIDFGNLHDVKGEVDSAIHYYQMADSVAGIYKNLYVKSVALSNIGSLYQKYKIDNAKALIYLEEAFQFIEYTTSFNKITVYQNLGVAYRKAGRDSLALIMAQNSYDIAVGEGLLGDAAAAINSMAVIYQENGQYKKALEAFMQARDIAVKLNITKGIIFTNANIAQTYYELGEYQKGLALFEKVLVMVKEHQMTYVELTIYQDLIKFYTKTGSYQKAYKTSESYRKLSDSLALNEKEKHISELETRYQTQIKEATIADQKAQIKEERTFILLLSVIIFLILASLIIISRLFILKHKSLKKLVKAHKELTSKNAQILNLIPCQPQNQASDLNQNNDFIYQKAYSYLITNRNFLDEDLSLEKLSSAIGINREYIRNAIKNIEDCNFKTFLNNQRIDHAKKLIMADVMNKLSIEEIAHQSGFSSRTSFYRIFHDITGFTPAFYKNQLHKNAASAN